MKTSDFQFELPAELIAQHPAPVRGSERLMVVDRGSSGIGHRIISDLPDLVEPGTLMVVNDSRVRKARLYARPVARTGTQSDPAGAPLDPPDAAAASALGGGRAGEQVESEPPTGRAVELLLLEPVDGSAWRVLCTRAKRQRPGQRYLLDAGVTGRVERVEGEFRVVRFTPPIDDEWLERHGHVPLPPYIRRPDTEEDADRYQTVYARAVGSVASPTAGLHLTSELIDKLADRGVQTVRITLHVGIGTFLPIRTAEVEAHVMHEEHYEVGDEAAEAVNRARSEGRPILAVGTTSVRTLEASQVKGRLVAGRGSTRLFIYPGYRFTIVDELLTNFHTPGSSLILLVAAFGGTELMKRAYDEAVRERYRFFSYGDAMLIRGRAR